MTIWTLLNSHLKRGSIFRHPMGTPVAAYLLFHSEVDLNALSGTSLTDAVNISMWSRLHGSQTIADTGTYSIYPDFGGGTNFKILLVDSSGDWDISDGDFSIKSLVLNTPPDYKPAALIKPDGTTKWIDGSADTILWNSGDFTGPVSFYYLNHNTQDLDVTDDAGTGVKC